MINELKFVQGSVAKKDLIPALTHFAIDSGTVRGYNGTLALCSPIALDITCNPQAAALIKAIDNCSDVIQMALTPAKRLSIKSGKFKAFVDCYDGEPPHAKPEGELHSINGEELLKCFKVMAPFVGDDASRPWSNGILLSGQSAFATNNITLIEYWTGIDIQPALNIPRAAVKEIIRINEAPESIQFTDTSATFHYSGDRWLRTQLFANNWPNLARILNKECTATSLTPELFAGLKVLKPFVGTFGSVRFYPGKISTHVTEGEGAVYEIEGFDHTGVYDIAMLTLLQGVADRIDWSPYPAPALFFGDRLRGAIVGMRE